MRFTRRDTLAAAGLAGAALGAVPVLSQSAPDRAGWQRGFDNQRIADLGDGRFLNPLMAGDHPDPTILKDGRDYYMTFSTFDSYPGLVIWHSRDLVNWRPLNAALTTNIGSVWAPELTKHKGRYYTLRPDQEPDDQLGHPGGSYRGAVERADRSEIAGAYRSGPCGGRGRIALAVPVGRRPRAPVRRWPQPYRLYDPWRYPDGWDVEGFSPEGPKVLRRGGWFYLILAVGGTAGPPTGHMVIAARSRSIHGPWEDCPHNPIVRTTSLDEKWWSRGHATLVEGPAGDWWSVYHGYENGYWTLGRQTLLDPVEWTADGWFRMTGGDLSQPIAKPKGGSKAGPHGQPLSDDFTTLAIGAKWNFFKPAADGRDRARVAGGALRLAARGKAPSDSSPLLLIAGDPAYRFECDIEIAPGGQHRADPVP